MKIKLLIITLAVSLKMQAQTYHPLLDSVNRWSYVLNFFPVSPRSIVPNCGYPFWGDIMYTGADTTINSINYKKLYGDYFLFTNACLFGFIREDTALRTVYFQDVDSTPEIILYDFSMQVGDTMSLNFTAAVGGYFQNGNYTLDSVGSMTIQQGNRNVFYLNCHSCSNSNTLQWVEGVGNLENVIYPYADNSYGGGPFSMCPGYPHGSFQFLICYEHINKVYYDSCAYHTALLDNCFAITDTCEYYNTCGAISELSSSYPPIKFIPNPFNNAANIILTDILFLNSDLIIFDRMGRIVREMKISDQLMEFKRNSLPDGIYYYMLIDDHGKAANGKFVIE